MKLSDIAFKCDIQRSLLNDKMKNSMREMEKQINKSEIIDLVECK